jgi:uncharacterized membrane-anchored protein
LKKLFWARELALGDAPGHRLTYDARVLGRSGVLVLKAVADMKQLPEIEQALRALIAIDFAEGHRYGEFDARTDRVSTESVAALIAGRVVEKPGAFEGLHLLLQTGTKLVKAAVVALGIMAVGVAVATAALSRRRRTA